MSGTGPLSGVRVIELAGIGPGPYAGMMLADMGADVLRVDRASAVGSQGGQRTDILGRGRRSVGIDLKHPEGRDAVLRLVESADALIEGFRPGVTERLGLGPDDCLARNPKLVYGRMTGWGQEGPYAPTAGHDINYIALSGTLSLIGRKGAPPTPPVNIIGDFGGGGMFLAFGVVCGILEASRSGQGQVVDAAMVDGAAVLAAMVWGFKAGGGWGERGTNLLDTGAWYYDVFETSDGGWISLGSLEPQFFAEMIRITGLAADVDGGGPIPPQGDKATWPAAKDRLAAIIRTKSRDEWCALMEGTDVCFAPVLDLDEAAAHPHHVQRSTFVEVDGVMQPAPAPRFSRTPGAIRSSAPAAGEHTDEALSSWGLDEAEIAKLHAAGAIS
jgi:alpha-methylacyl-CoA racemase